MERITKRLDTPKNCTREQYYYVKKHIDVKPYVSGFIGFGCSHSGRWMSDSSYASDNTGRNYCLNAHNSVLKKIEKLKDVVFYNLDYSEVDIPLGSIIYCDPHYMNVTQYSNKEVGKFDHNKFYFWVKENSNKYIILISEYEKNVPKDFEIVWRKESKQDIRGKNGQEKTVEILMKYKG